MKPFHFSLQAVRTLRARQEQLARETFGRAVQARQRAFDRQQLAEQQLAEAQTQLARLQSGRVPIFRINQSRAHCQLLEQQVSGQRLATAQAQAAANEAWETLQEARQQQDLVNRFFERRRDEYDREMREDEQKQLDEMAGQRWLAGPVIVPPTMAAWN